MKQLHGSLLCIAMLALIFSGSLSASDEQDVAGQLDCKQTEDKAAIDRQTNSHEIIQLQKRLALMKKMVAQLSKELEDIKTKKCTTTRSFKSAEQIFKEHEWINTMTHFLSKNAYSLISTACAVIGLGFSYYFNRQQILLTKAQLFWAQNAAAVTYLHELASGAYESYFNHVKEFPKQKARA